MYGNWYKFREVLDLLNIRNKNYNNYTEILRYVLFEGLNNLTNKLILFKTHEQNDLLYENDCSIINK